MQTAFLILILIIAALALIVAEIITPSFGMLGTCAAACLIWAGYNCFEISNILGIVYVVCGVIGIPFYLTYMMRVVPDTRVGRWLFLKRAESAESEALPQSQSNNELIGKTGTCHSDLRPIGTVKIDGKKVDAIAESGFLDSGQNVEAIGISGANIVVRPVEEPANESTSNIDE